MQESLLRSQLQNRMFHNIRRLPKDLQAQLAKKLTTADPEKVKEIRLRNRIKRFMDSTDMNKTALEGMRTMAKLNEEELYGTAKAKDPNSNKLSPEAKRNQQQQLNSTTMNEKAG